MYITNPIKGFKNSYPPKGDVTQYFGENKELYMSAMGLEGHNGIDVVAPHGTPMYAVEGGIVCEVNDNPAGFGKHVRFLTQTGEKVEREWTYGHCHKIYVKIGDTIKPGQHIADMGNTGFVVSSASYNALGFWDRGGNKYNGTHLHLGCREIVYAKKGGWRYSPATPKFNVLNYNNGFKGAIDFVKMFNPNSQLGDMEILKRQLEVDASADWYTKLIKSLKFFGF